MASVADGKSGRGSFEKITRSGSVGICKKFEILDIGRILTASRVATLTARQLLGRGAAEPQPTPGLLVTGE